MKEHLFTFHPNKYVIYKRGDLCTKEEFYWFLLVYRIIVQGDVIL